MLFIVVYTLRSTASQPHVGFSWRHSLVSLCDAHADTPSHCHSHSHVLTHRAVPPAHRALLSTSWAACVRPTATAARRPALVVSLLRFRRLLTKRERATSASGCRHHRPAPVVRSASGGIARLCRAMACRCGDLCSQSTRRHRRRCGCFTPSRTTYPILPSSPWYIPTSLHNPPSLDATPR
jgi:hypothetical protein